MVFRTKFLEPWTVSYRFLAKQVFSFSSDVFLRKMAPVKRKLTNESLAEKCKALKDLENGLSHKDIATK